MKPQPLAPVPQHVLDTIAGALHQLNSYPANAYGIAICNDILQLILDDANYGITPTTTTTTHTTTEKE